MCMYRVYEAPALSAGEGRQFTEAYCVRQTSDQVVALHLQPRQQDRH